MRHPRELLEKLVKSDPLELRRLCREHLSSSALLLDEGRLFLRATASVAHDAPRFDASTPLEDWLRDAVAGAAERLIVEDQESYESGIPPLESWDPVSPSLLERLPIEPRLARGVAVTFNRLPIEERRVFYALVIEGESLEACAQRTGRSAPSLRESVREILNCLSQLGPPAPDRAPQPDPKADFDSYSREEGKP